MEGEDQVNIDDAWALVAMADRINEGKYIKHIEYAVDPATGLHTNEIRYRPNRELIKQSLETGVPAITADDQQLGAKMSEHFQGLIFDMLGNEPNEYDRVVFQIIQKPTVGHRTGIAYMASLAQKYHRDLAKESISELTAELQRTSSHQGQIDDILRLQVKVISKFPGRTFPGSIVRATDGYNLYFWTSSKLVEHWPTKEFTVVGAVKSHGVDYRNNCLETRLTRVKIVAY